MGPRVFQLFVRTIVLAALFFPWAGMVSAAPEEGGPVVASVSIQGSMAVVAFAIPKKPAGSVFHLSIDHARLLGRSVMPGKILTLCIDHLPPGRHLLGYELAGPDQIVRTDERFVSVEIPSKSSIRTCHSGGENS